MLTVNVDRDTCISCGLCPNICPGVYMMDDDNVATVAAQPGPGELPCAVEAAESCPVNAIDVVQ